MSKNSEIFNNEDATSYVLTAGCSVPAYMIIFDSVCIPKNKAVFYNSKFIW